MCDAWQSVAPSTIVNCWQHTGILSSARVEGFASEAEDFETANLDELTGLLSLLNSSGESMSATDYVSCDTGVETAHALTDQQILELISSNEQSQQEEDDSDPPPHVTVEQALNSVHTLVTFLEQTKEINEDMHYLRSLQYKIQTHYVSSATKQKKLTNIYMY